MKGEDFGKPYASNAELPKGVRDALPSSAQTVYRGAYNAADEKGWKTARRHQYAWGAVKRNWKQNAAGEWVKKAGTLGRMGGTAEGPDGKCVCPSCGTTKAHATGTPCYNETCPDCGGKMTRAIVTAKEARANMRKQMPEGAEFEATAELIKAYEGDDGERFLVIKASDTQPDRQGGSDPSTGHKWVAERISANFMEKMEASADGGAIELIDGHHSAMPMGASVGHNADLSDEQVRVFAPSFQVAKNSAAGNQLWEDAMAGKYDREFSVGGKAHAAFLEYDETMGGIVKVLDDGVLDHVAVCRPGTAANPRTSFVEAFGKALSDAEVEVPFVGDEADLAKVELSTWSTGEGGVEVNLYGSDIGEALGDMAPYGCTDFVEGLMAVRQGFLLPALDKVYEQVTRAIHNDDELSIEQKRALMLAAVDDYHDAQRAIIEGEADGLLALSKNAEGGTDDMAVDKAAIKEALAEVLAEMSKDAGDGADPSDAVVDGLIGLDDDARRQLAMTLLGDSGADSMLAKLMVELPTLDGPSLSRVRTALAGHDAEAGLAGLIKAVEGQSDDITKLLEGIATLVEKVGDASPAAPAGEGGAPPTTEGDTPPATPAPEGDTPPEGDAAAKGDAATEGDEADLVKVARTAATIAVTELRKTQMADQTAERRSEQDPDLDADPDADPEGDPGTLEDGIGADLRKTIDEGGVTALLR